MTPGSLQPGTGPAAFAAAFPFHLVIAPSLALNQIGSGLQRIDPGLRPGAPFAEHFTLDEPRAPLSWQLLAESPTQLFCLRHRQTGLELRGQMLVPEADGPAIFLGSSWLSDPSQLAEFGLSLGACVGHDVGLERLARAATNAATDEKLISAEAGERLRRLTSELAAIFQLSPDGFVAFNEAGIRSYINPAFVRMTGLTRDELEGVDEASFEARLAALYDPAKPPQAAADGSEVIHLARPQPTVLRRSRREARDADGRLFGRILYFRDMTPEAALDRMRNEFLSTAAHELRTPMASIHGFTELLLRCEFDAGKRRDILETIFRQTSRLVDMVNGLLDLTRIEACAAQDLRLVRQPLVPVIRSALAELLIRDDPRRVRTRLAKDAGSSPWVEIDRDKFLQALTNVLANAYKYSPQGGAISLTLRHRRDATRRWVGVAVRDHGIGMNEDEAKRVFERFFRAESSRNVPGTGLGMSLVKELMDLHQGHAEIVSAPGRGTEVTLWLPALPADEG